MAVLPWGHSRTRTTSTDKKQHTPLDWFSRNTSEPSRQALTSLMKEHSRNLSGGSGSAKSRSETTTSHSHRSHRSHRSQNSNHSHHSRHCGAKSEASNGTTSAQTTQQPRSVSPARSTVSAFDRPENSNRSRFSRSGGLKRMSSKLSLSDSASISGVIMISPPRFTASRMGFRKKDPVSPEKDVKPSISKPFDFQHVSHTEQTDFEGLGRIDESDLISQYDALQFGQQLETELRGIQASDLGVVTPPQPVSTSYLPSPSSPVMVVARPVTPSSSKAFELPMTPPRPNPPPKDLSLVTPLRTSDVRMSRSMENFSRPTTRSPTAQTNVSPLRSLPPQSQLAPAAMILDGRAATPDGPVAKPLPSLPSVIHAVSTQDETARYMIAAPLPSPPAYRAEHNVLSNHKRQSSSKGSLRHMSTFPSARNPTLLESQLRGIQEESEPLPRHFSDNALSRHLARHDSQESHRSSRMSVVNNIATDDWEDAIDFAWDQDSSDVVGSEDVDTRSSFLRPSGSQGSLLMVQQPVYDRSSAASTPQMTMAASHSPHTSTDIDPSFLSMYGLGIDSSKNRETAKISEPPSLHVSVPDQDSYTTLQRLPRTTYSALSKSSSQESIILSIASSIMGTQRSSNSSVSPGDLVQWSKIDEIPSATTTNSSPLLMAGSLKPARPESTCVPASLLKGFTAPVTSSLSNASHEIEQTTATVPFAKEAEDHIAPLASQTQYEKDASSSSYPTSDCISTTTYNSSSTHNRRRASTSGSNRRPARTSYSLFPTTARTTSNPSLTT